MLTTSTSLIARVRDPQDSQSWQEFVQLYEPLLYSYVRGRGLEASEARDVVQDVFIVLLRALPTFELDNRKGRFKTWLWQVTMNAVADHCRRTRSRQRAEGGWQERAERQGPKPTVGAEPDAAFIAAHRQRVLEHVLPIVRAQTQAKTWQCFEQYILRGRPGVEVAREVGLPANSVYVHASRVLDKVRARCADYAEE
jgi:RNA polymerase sigma-70 factor (ECF subfamily)